MIVISNELLDTLDLIKSPEQNQYPFISTIIKSFDLLESQKKNLIYEKIWLELYRGSWNSINKSIPLKAFTFDKKTGYHTATAVATTELRKNNLVDKLFFIRVDSHELLFNFECCNITAQKHYRASTSITPVTLTSLEKQSGIESIKKALKKAELKFTLDFSVTGLYSSQTSNRGIKSQENLMKEKVHNAFWNVLYSEGISDFGAFEINHIKRLYNKTISCFIDFANCPKNKQFVIFEKALEKAKSSRISDAQALYYEIVKNNLDTRVKIKKEQIWNKVAEKIARNVPDQFVLAKNSSRTHNGNILDIVFIKKKKRGNYESFHVSDLWNLLNVE